MNTPAGTDADKPQVPDWRSQIVTDFACPSCGYDLTHNPVPRCPECGYALNSNDIQYTEHRKIFLDLTRKAPFVRHGVAVLFMLVAVPYVGILIALPPMLSHLAMSSARGRGQECRLRRRVWAMSTVWLQIPWIVIGLASEVYDWMSYRSSFMYAMNAPDQLTDLPEELLFVGTISAFAGGFWMWRRSLKSLATKATFQPDDPVLLWRTSATRVALISYGLACFLLVIPVMLWALDTFWPGWA